MHCFNKLFRFGLLVALCIATSVWGGSAALAEASASPQATYQNPVFDESFADPVIFRAEDGTIYAYGTPDVWSDGELHLCGILKSRDLVHWEYVGDVFDAVPAWNNGAAIWATELRQVGDLYNFYYTLIDEAEANPAIGMAIADHPEGPFYDVGMVLSKNKGAGIYCIDPFVTAAADGTLYLIFGNYEEGCWYVELTPDGLTPVGEKQWFSPGFEGAYVIERGGYYYLFGSLGSVWEGEKSTYHVCVARSERLLGPYVNKAGEPLTEQNKASFVLLAPGQGERFFGGPGNNAVIQDDAGDDWIVYHAVDSRTPYLADGATRRPLCIDRLLWDEQGWPYVAGGVPSVESMTAPVFH